MSGNPPDVGGPPPVPPEPRSFLDALNTPSLPSSSSQPQPHITMHKGEPAILFPQSLVASFSQPYKYALIGKFSQGRPQMEVIRNFFVAQDFKFPFTVGLLDSRHIILNLQGEADFLRVYSRSLWYIAGRAMRVFKWTHSFHVDRESSIVPLWFKLSKLPIQFFNKEALFGIAKTFGYPLRLDSATLAFKRPSVARLQVEIDLLKPIPSRVWIGMEGSLGFWQKIEVDEDLPSYCQYCWHVGHSETVCHVKHPELKPIVKKSLPSAASNLQYKPKEKAAVATAVFADAAQQNSYSAEIVPKEKAADAAAVFADATAIVDVPVPQQKPNSTNSQHHAPDEANLHAELQSVSQVPTEVASLLLPSQNVDPPAIEPQAFLIAPSLMNTSPDNLQQSHSEDILVLLDNFQQHQTGSLSTNKTIGDVKQPSKSQPLRRTNSEGRTISLNRSRAEQL